MIKRKTDLQYLLGILALVGVYLTSLYSYLLFHSLAEIFSVIIAISIFATLWNSRRFIDNNYLLIIGIAYLFIGGLDLIHTLTYKGMGIFTGYDANLPTQLWIAARYLESLSLFTATFCINRKVKANVIFFIYTAIFSLALLSIFYWQIFPDCFIEGSGLTLFKKISEYIISLILVASIVTLRRRRSKFEGDIFRLIVASIILTIGAELAFTFYVSVYGFSNLIGHYFKILSFYFLYKAIIETGINKPYNLIFSSLTRSNESLRKAHGELAGQVDDSTRELVNTKKDLQKLAGRLILHQEKELSRLARELHDDLTQQLAVTAIEAGSIAQECKDLPEPVLQRIVRIKEQLIKISKDVHNMSRDLHPSILNDLGLERAVKSECSNFSSRTGIAVIFTPKNIFGNIPKDKALALYRIVQEGLSNILKHAETKNAYVFLEGSDHGLILTVRDTGVGFDQKEVRQHAALGFGSIKERVRLINGKSSITSNPGKGTTIEVSIPL